MNRICQLPLCPVMYTNFQYKKYRARCAHGRRISMAQLVDTVGSSRYFLRIRTSFVPHYDVQTVSICLSRKLSEISSMFGCFPYMVSDVSCVPCCQNGVKTSQKSAGPRSARFLEILLFEVQNINSKPKKK